MTESNDPGDLTGDEFRRLHQVIVDDPATTPRDAFAAMYAIAAVRPDTPTGTEPATQFVPVPAPNNAQGSSGRGAKPMPISARDEFSDLFRSRTDTLRRSY